MIKRGRGRPKLPNPSKVTFVRFPYQVAMALENKRREMCCSTSHLIVAAVKFYLGIR